MNKIKLDYSNTEKFISKEEISNFQERVNKCHHALHDGSGEGSEYLGWIDFPNKIKKRELDRINNQAENIKNQSDVFIVVGIGGSYLGARAAIETLNHNFYNELPRDKRKGPRVYFAGQNISSSYLKDLLDLIEGEDLSINVVSKSGTTTEPAITFRILREYMENKYGREEASNRIYVTTDKSKGALKALSEKEGYKSFEIPDDVGGRYSVLTPVGLLPMAVAGIDIEEVIRGAKDASIRLEDPNIGKNHAYLYGVLRNILYSKGKTNEALVNYEPNLFYFGEWYKQLFGESEGKEGKGILPMSLNFTTDLHSMGQYIQDGIKNIFETTISIENSEEEIYIKKDDSNLDGLNYLVGKSFEDVNEKAMEGTIEAHVDGEVPNLILKVPEINEYYFGYLVYFFQKACAMSGYLLGINPFNQPGVEAYKSNMFRLLEKPGI